MKNKILVLSLMVSLSGLTSLCPEGQSTCQTENGGCGTEKPQEETSSTNQPPRNEIEVEDVGGI